MIQKILAIGKRPPKWYTSVSSALSLSMREPPSTHWMCTSFKRLSLLTAWIRNLASVMFAPGADALCAEFGITNSTIAALTVTIYILGFALGPLFISPLSEIYGRLIVYHVGNGVYLGFTIGCALSTNTAMFMVFRFMCGVAAASPMSIGGGTIADLYRQEESGKAMALFGLGPLLGPVWLSLSVPRRFHRMLC